MRSAALLAVIASIAIHAQEAPPAPRWFKGNTHTHTLNSDGDSTPDDVVRWYREHGYHFLVLSDHNYLTSVDGLNAVHGADAKFLVIRGEEVTETFEKKAVHVNGLGVEQRVAPQGGPTVAAILQRNVDAVRNVKGVPHINHPNYTWAITPEDLRKVERYRLFEIFNGHPHVNNEGGGGRPGLEEVWDMLLSSGKRVFGIAVDDAHHFKRPWDRDASPPGRGWVVVRAARLEANAILTAMERGDFYASTGVELKDITVVPRTSVKIEIVAKGDTKHRTTFIGMDGKVLATSTENPAVYPIRGSEGYVRAKVVDSNGWVAWIQPHFVD